MPKKPLIKTHIPRLDEALGGGILRGRGLGIYGPPGIGKTVLCMQIAYNNISKSRQVSYYTDDVSADDILNYMKSFGWDPEPFSEYFLLEDRLARLEKDASEQLGASMDVSTSSRIVSSKMDIMKWLNTTISDLRDYFGGYPDMLIIDSATPWLLQLGGRKLYLLFQVAKRMFARSTASIVTIQNDVADQRTMNSLFSLSDYLIQMKREDEYNIIQVEKSKTRVDNPILPYKITNEGISFLSGFPRQTGLEFDVSGGAFSSTLGVDYSKLKGHQILFEHDPLTRYDLSINDFCNESINRNQEVIIITSKFSAIHKILDGRNNVHFRTSVESRLLSPLLEKYTDKDIVMIVDGLTERIILDGFEATFYYIKNAIDIFSERGITALFMINPTAHSPREIASIRGIFTNHIIYDGDGIRLHRLG